MNATSGRKNQQLINKTRHSFKEAASQSSTLFFALTEISNLNPIHQVSLEWYVPSSTSFNFSREVGRPISPRTELERLLSFLTFFSRLLEFICHGVFTLVSAR